MDMLDSESDSSPPNSPRKYADILNEFGQLVEEMDMYLEELNVLKHEIRQLEDTTRRETLEVLPDNEVLEKYDRTMGLLKEAYFTTEKALSICELKAAELRPVFYGIKPRYAAAQER